MQLADELILGIFERAWACRGPLKGAEEVRRAADLHNVCRRVRGMLRAHPLPLALDLSAAELSGAQRAWLAAPVRVGRVEAACFHPSERLLWQCGSFLRQHGGSLQRLAGVPLCLVSAEAEGAAPALDLSGLRLAEAGVACPGRGAAGGPAPRVWLAPAVWPASLVRLELVVSDFAPREQHVLRERHLLARLRWGVGGWGPQRPS